LKLRRIDKLTLLRFDGQKECLYNEHGGIQNERTKEI